MAYRHDPDLDFLKNCQSHDLDVLVTLLTHDSDGSIRLTEDLTSHELYKAHYPDHSAYWHVIAEEIQCFGANTFAMWLRSGEGVLYSEVLEDVCDKIGVTCNGTVEEIELELLTKILMDSLDDMSQEQIKKLLNGLQVSSTNLTKQAVVAALQGAVRLGGFASYQVVVIVANAVAKLVTGTGLKLATNAALTRTVSYFVGPIGWALTGLWTAVDIAGPAYRVTIPAVIQVSFLRASLQYNSKLIEYKPVGRIRALLDYVW